MMSYPKTSKIGIYNVHVTFALETARRLVEPVTRPGYTLTRAA
jgi:hypothetical protein